MLKYLLVCFTTFLSFAHVWSQRSSEAFMVNKGIITYVDHARNGHFSISFPGDTVVQVDKPAGFLIDSSFYQKINWDTPGNGSDLWDNAETANVLDSFYRVEKDYVQQTVLKESGNLIEERFVNQYDKQFVLWYYEIPFLVRGLDRKNKDPEEGGAKTMHFQVNLMFIVNKKVIMISRSVAEDEQLEKVLAQIKTEVANSVKVFFPERPISMAVLSGQVDSRISGKPFTVDLKDYKTLFEIPDWMSIVEDARLDLFATFPEVDGIANAVSVLFVTKKSDDSFKDFCSNTTTLMPGAVVTERKSSRRKFKEFDVSHTGSNGVKFQGRFAFFETKEKYCWINFTGTDKTFDKNIKRFEGFINTIKLY